MQPVHPKPSLTLSALFDRFLTQEAPRRYRKHGRPTRQLQNMTAMLEHILETEIGEERLFDRPPTRSAVNGRKTIRAVRDLDVAIDLRVQDLEDCLDAIAHRTVRGGKPISVTHVNKHRTALITVLRWGRKVGLVPPIRVAELEAVEPVKFGQTPARKTKRVKSAGEADVRALLDFISRYAERLPQRTRSQWTRRLNWKLFALAATVAWETGMRRGELVQMRPADIEKRWHDDELYWVYLPPTHKSDDTDDEPKVIWLTPIAAAAVGEAMELNRMHGDQYVLPFGVDFSNQTQLWPWRSGDPDVDGNGFYNKMTEAVKLFNQKSGREMAHMHPHQFRHAFTSRSVLIDPHGAQHQLGHKDLKTTMGYFHAQNEAARKLIDRL